ncbi:ABC transporter substrate-binding protein [Nocardia sp. NBC_00565]|uniref:ABC transporter substrate-binding protein n=1 Tax=Nocardia sp. NBC_00565 TaxID=2975993 RepID=UPI002E81DF15|nr:ABC transporter substrate-binding protein [Nocardia sp. NBC_00565]WUC05527.1 ABC transporter substrate-binding protein [Nocardia sp. NBC_00565]
MKPQRILVALLAVALLVAGCSGRSGGGGRGDVEAAAKGGGDTAVSADFGDLKNVCQPGKATSSPTQGVTADRIEVGVFTDMGLTKKTEFPDAAKVFTSWCNANGGINGRKLTVNVRDTKYTEVRQRMLEACREDFALVGGSAALDGLGVKDRLSCLLPDFPAQLGEPSNAGADLQIGGGVNAARPYDPYVGMHQWLFNEVYPNSAGAIGILAGDSPVTKIRAIKYAEGLPAEGATLVYSDLIPATGVTDWTPYAQAMKSKGVRGLFFMGDFRSLAKLELVLADMQYKLDWIDINNNAYSQAFLELAGKSLATQNNYADLSGTAPLELSDTIPAVAQAKSLFAKYAPGAELTYPALRALSQWLLFAKTAASCGDNLTRTCLLDNARKEKAWTAGGLQAPVDMSSQSILPKCFNVVQPTPDGWKVADFKPDTGPFRCDMNPYVYKGDYGKAMTLADVGKSMSDVK